MYVFLEIKKNILKSYKYPDIGSRFFGFYYYTADSYLHFCVCELMGGYPLKTCFDM